MASARVTVLLFAWPAGQKLSPEPGKEWYERYVFNLAYGQASYWAAQSDYAVILNGRVLDWERVEDPDTALLGDREKALDFAIAKMEKDRDVEFDAHDMVILVVATPRGVSVNGGSATATSKTGSHSGILVRTGTRFDFLAHEIGHALKLHHSYGDQTYRAASWSLPGEYGHPYCVMSAQSYGGIARPFRPRSPRDNRQEYSGLGPSLNAATALARGWIDAYQYDVPGGQPTEVVLRSRHWWGRDQGLPPQALNVRASDGRNWVMEYREAESWDRGQDVSVFIVNHGRGSTADRAHPDTGSATCLAALRVPVTFDGSASAYHRPEFGVQVLDRSAVDHTITVQVFSGLAPLIYSELTSSLEVIDETTLDVGETYFEPETTICTDGVWPYEKVARSQVATLEATYAIARPPIAAEWTVDGQPLVKPAGTIVLPTEVSIATRTLEDIRDTRNVNVRYEIEPVATGSRLRLFNNPHEESYTLHVGATLTTAVGSGSVDGPVRFQGVKYVYPPEFYQERFACLADFGRIADQYPEYEVLLPPPVWKKVPEERFLEVQQLLDALSYLRGLEDERPYLQAVTVLEDLAGISPAELRVVALDGVVEWARPDPHLGPPAPVAPG